MFKLVILNSDIESLKNFCNSVINEISDVQLSGICTSFEEFDSIFSKVKPRLIMMNYSDYIHSKYSRKSEYPHFKILFCNTNPSAKKLNKSLYLFKNAEPQEMIKSINEFVKTQHLIIARKKVIKLLENLNFDFKLIGTTHLLESILYCYENKTDYVFENLERKVYPQVAKRCHVTEENVKWSIVRTINIMNARINCHVQKQLSDNLKLDASEKATAKQLITTIITKLD